MLVSTVLLLGYQLTAPRAGLASIRASAGRMSAAEDAAKAAWLAKQDTPAYGGAAASAAGAAVSPGPMSSAGEEAAKNAWLAKMDAPAWGVAAAAVAAASASAASASSANEEEAKRAWLAKLDAPTWGKAASALVNIAGQAGASAAMEEACDQGVEVACDGMSREEEAKRAYLAKLDAPTWGAVTAAVSAVASAVTVGGGGAVSAEDIAKQKWLAASDTLFR